MDSLYVQQVRIKDDIPAGNYIKNLPVVKNLIDMGGLKFNKPVTFLVGENGIGKSTLIEAMAVSYGFNPEGGTKNFNFNTCNSHSDLHQHVTLVKGFNRARDGFFLRAESFYNVSSNIDKLDSEPAGGARVIDSYGGKSLHAQSHGESFLALVKNRFGGNGLYILDEPEAALSPSGIMKLMVLMNDLVKNNSQFIISTHSPMLISFPDADVYEITNQGINLVPYNQTEHFSMTKMFIENPERMLKHLLQDW